MFIIQMSEDEPFWLKSWNENCWEWTANTKDAKWFDRDEAERLLWQVKRFSPDAMLVKV